MCQKILEWFYWCGQFHEIIEVLLKKVLLKKNWQKAEVNIAKNKSGKLARLFPNSI